MIALYKKWRDKADIIRWGLDIFNHNQLDNNTYGKIIQEVLLLKCFFYYDYEEIMRDLPTINSPFLMGSGHLDYGAQLKEESFYKNDLCNLNI